MSQKILDYTLDSLTPANPDSTLPATVTGCTVVAGPGVTSLGTFPKALDFGANGQLHVALPVASLNRVKFCIRTVFKIDAAVTARQNLVASTALPIAFYVVPGSGGSDFHLVASVTTTAHGSGRASTEFLLNLHLGQWYVADLVYDTDTVAILVNDVAYSVHAFPNGTLAAGSADQLFAGISTSGTGDQFKGQMAALQLHADIPIDLEAQLDERRSHPQWYLTYKQEEIKSTHGFGAPAGEFFYDVASTAWIQRFANGYITYHDSQGHAFELHGAIAQTYWAMPNRAEIGFPISDELNGAQGGSRKSFFSRGGIYWSPATGAVPVIGQIWVDYEGMGEADAIGLPISPAVAIPGGWRQIFQQAQMFHKSTETKAFEVHGAILAKYIALGGPAVFGFPVSNEGPILNNSVSIGRVSEFERCTIYWSAATGAYEVHGDIRDRYRGVSGPSGALGFPTSDEADVPGAAGRYNTFQHGSIVWFGSVAQTYVCLAFDITLGRVNTKESEGWLRGQNDVYMHATIEDNGHVIHSERLPSSGDSDGHNIYTVNKTFDLGPSGIVPNSPSRVITFSLDIWDSDWPDDDDHLGEFSHTLSMANAWGVRDNPSGLFDSGSFDNINSITWAVSPRVDEALLTDAQKWWGVRNKGTDSISWQQYASAFRDVDSDTEWWDPTDWLAAIFYELVVEGLAKNGNCFGMSLEAIYSKKHRSILRLPIDRFTVWEDVRNEFNIKHQYQVGAPALWWFVGEFLSGKTHDPVAVFRASRAAFLTGADPVMCIAQNYDFSGAPHCILPVGWNDTVKPWQILIRDPNFQTMTPADPPRVLNVDPDNNTYSYDGGSNKYSGGEWSGGRLHFMPYSLLNEQPRTPIFEAMMLILSGVILILGADSETISLTDEHGIDLDAFGGDAINRLQNGRPLTNKFVSVKGFDQERDCAKDRGKTPRPDDKYVPRRPRGHGVLASELHMRSDPRRFSRTAPPNKRGGDDWTRVTLKEYLCQGAPADIREKFKRYADFVATNQGRLIYRLLSTPIGKEIIGAAMSSSAVTAAAAAAADGAAVDQFPAISKNFVHTIRGVRGGRFHYGLKQGLSQMLLTADTLAGEANTIQVKDLGSHTNAITIKGAKDRHFNLVVHHKLGAGRDYLRMTIDRIPLAAGGELTINVKPGIGGVELLSAGQKIETNVAFEYVRQGTELRSTFALKEQHGMRVVPSTFITGNVLKVSRINTLFGDPISSTLVEAE